MYGIPLPYKKSNVHKLLKYVQEGRTIVETKTADIIQETRKLQIRRKGSNLEVQNQTPGMNSSLEQPIQQQNQTNHETQLKASRDVRWHPCSEWTA